jgi:hypothetical protein
MSDLRESFITLRSEEYKEEDTRFHITLRLDFGMNECQDRFQRIQQLGVEPCNNTVVIMHDFATEEAAQDMVAKLNGFKDTMGAELGSFINFCETIKAKGRQLVVCFRAPADISNNLEILGPMAASMGELASVNQFVEFKIASTSNLKDVLTTQSESPASVLLSGVLIKLSLLAHKELPIKITDFISNLVPEYEKQEVKMTGRLISAFHHLKLNIELRNPDEGAKEAYKNEMIEGIMSMAQFVCGIAEQFGFLEVAKSGGSQTVAMICLSPLFSAEFTLYAPTAIEALEKAANPM